MPMMTILYLSHFHTQIKDRTKHNTVSAQRRFDVDTNCLDANNVVTTLKRRRVFNGKK